MDKLAELQSEINTLRFETENRVNTLIHFLNDSDEKAKKILSDYFKGKKEDMTLREHFDINLSYDLLRQSTDNLRVYVCGHSYYDWSESSKSRSPSPQPKKDKKKK